MDIKTYRARTMREALDLVRDDLGPEASVLHARELNRGPIARWLRGAVVEVAAAAPRRVAEGSRGEPASAVRAGARSFATQRSPAMQDEAPARVHQSPRTATSARASRALADALFHCHGALLDAGFEPPMARELAERVQRRLRAEKSDDPARVPLLAWEAIRDAITTSGGIRFAAPSPFAPRRARVVALVGPTGVGKTTTLAKLAANARIDDGLRVGLVTIDTYRVAAVEQLGAYADIMDLPMEVVANATELRGALDRLAGLDLVLIDTAGRSPRDAERLEELRLLLAEASIDETHLVLSATTASRGLEEAARRFAAVGVSSLLFTKLDEAVTLGQLVGLAHGLSLPISYLTDGQSVPEDIRPADAEWLAERVLDGVNS
ncbi:MAG: flagellar biosynthesis protein FlhF [Lacipirellulaceae bacterium]